MQKSESRTNMLVVGLLCFIGAFVAVFWYIWQGSYEKLFVTPAKSSVTIVEIGESRLNIPDWTYFNDNHIWAYVGNGKSLPTDLKPDVVDPEVAYTGSSMKISSQIQRPLSNLFQAADKDGVKLMLSSGYRSTEQQAEIYDFYLKQQGKQYVDSYVAKPSFSEHQLGLTVDIASSSTACKRSGDSCSLTAEAIAWLRANAARFGFIERYPAGKQSITSVAGEHWHYRYVGAPLAKALKSTNMTFDEFVQQTAPGFIK